QKKQNAKERRPFAFCFFELAEAVYFLSASSLARLASQSRERAWPLRPSLSILPLMVSPSTLPLYFWVILLPLFSRVTVKESSSPLILPSSILVSLSLRPMRAPVSFSPSCLSFSLGSKVWPFRSTFQVQVPVTLC